MRESQGVVSDPCWASASSEQLTGNQAVDHLIIGMSKDSNEHLACMLEDGIREVCAATKCSKLSCVTRNKLHVK